MSNIDRQKILTDQINLRITLLEKAKKGGQDFTVPTSLTKLREWELPEYGVFKIGSPSSFVTTHAIHGKKIKKLNNLLNFLKSKNNSKRKNKPVSKQLASAKKEINKLKGNISGAANQFVMYVSEIKSLKEDAALYEGIKTGLTDELEDLKDELKQLKKNMLKLENENIKLKTKTSKGKVTKVDFKRGD